MKFIARHKHKFAALVIIAVVALLWLNFNPMGRFGWCRYGFTTYNAWPRLISDIQIRADGSTRKISKTHELTFENIQWLLDSKPDVLIVALGWDGMTTPDERIQHYSGCQVQLLKNVEAITLFNRLKSEGRAVAIHFHSTC